MLIALLVFPLLIFLTSKTALTHAVIYRLGLLKIVYALGFSTMVPIINYYLQVLYIYTTSVDV